MVSFARLGGKEGGGVGLGGSLEGGACGGGGKVV